MLKTSAKQTTFEEILNAGTHGLGILLGVAALVILIISAAGTHGNAIKIVSSAVYGSTLIIMYLASTLYHSVWHVKAKKYLKVFDHIAIYFLIAGTYTPFMLVAIQGDWGWSLFGVIWGLAFLGLIFKLFFTGRFEFISVMIYVFMGWLVLIAAVPILHDLSRLAIYWLLAGGLSYTFGIIFYCIDHKLYFTHAVWHLFVLAGSACHFFAVLFYINLK